MRGTNLNWSEYLMSLHGTDIDIFFRIGKVVMVMVALEHPQG